MDKSGEREPVAQSLDPKRAKRRVQSKLSWFVTTRVNETPIPSPPPSPAAVAKVVENGVKVLDGSMGEGKRKRNSRRKFLDRASKEYADTYKEVVDNSRKQDNRIQCTKNSMHFDIDAVHLAIPKVIPWDFRCKLSEKLEEEISKTISAVDENSLLMGVVMQHKLSSRENIDPCEMNNFSTAELRKKEELSRKHSLHDHKEFSHHMDILGDFFDDSDFPSLCNQGTLDQKHGIVLSSPSKDGLSALAYKFKPTSAQPNGYNLPTSLTSLIPQRHEFHEILPTGQIEMFRLDREVENSCDSFEGGSISHVCDTYRIQDISCVPQSSLISVDETKMNSSFLSAAVSYKQELPSFSNGSICFLPEVHITNSDKGIVESKFSENHVSSSAAFYLESIQGNYDVVEFPNEVEKYRMSQSQLMDDECSRAGFNVWSAPKDRIACSQEVDSVPETWRKLRSCREKFKLLLSTNSKDASLITSLISGLVDVISETDIIYQSCNSMLYESLEPTSTFFVETDYISCYDKQVEMGSTFAQHGIGLYMMKCATFGSSLGCNSMADFFQEILTSSTNSMALGKLLAHECGTS